MRDIDKPAFPPHTRQERRGEPFRVPGNASGASQAGGSRASVGVTSSQVGASLEHDSAVRAAGCSSFRECAAALIGFAAALLLATGHLPLWAAWLAQAVLR